MGSQEIRQRARRQALGAAARQRKDRARRERRVKALAIQVLTAIGERDELVIATERRAGAALQQMTYGEGLTLTQAVEWCGDELSVREATRLRRLSILTSTDAATGDGHGDDGGGVDDGDDGASSEAAAKEGELSG
jgi:hypothetical protein